MNHIKVDVQNSIKSYKEKKCVIRSGLALLLLCGFGSVESSQLKEFDKQIAYKKYCDEQKKIDQEISKIPGARILYIDNVLAESVLKAPSKELSMIISGIEQRVFCKNKKNIILHGPSGTGKSCIAQAIATKCQIPCLFFNAGGVSSEYMNSGVQNLNKIFALAKNLNRPCILVFDELEALTKKHAGKDNHENNILISFWQELDNLKNSEVIVIGTMNSTEDLPVQIINRTTMIKIPLPEQKDRESVLSYYLNVQQKQYNITYPAGITSAYLAQKTNGFSHRDLESLVMDATMPTILDKKNKVVPVSCFDQGIMEIKKDPKRRLEREIGTWKHFFKTNLRNPKALTAGGLFVGVVGLCATIINQRENIANQKAAMIQTKEIADIQIKQAAKIAEDQRSWTTICKAALANIPVFVPGISAPIPAGAIIYSVIKYRDSIQEINEQGFSDSVKKNPKKFKDIK